MARVTKAVLREREKQCWKLAVEGGRTHDQIAEELHVERSTVTKMLGRLYQRKDAELISEISDEKRRQLEMLDYQISELMQAWIASKTVAKQITKKEKKKMLGLGEEKTTLGLGDEETIQKITDRLGDDNYLSGIRACLADKRKILGFGNESVLKIPALENSNVHFYIPDNGRK